MSEGSIKIFSPLRRKAALEEERRAASRPARSRLVIAALLLALGGVSIWYSQVERQERDAPSSFRLR